MTDGTQTSVQDGLPQQEGQTSEAVKPEETSQNQEPRKYSHEEVTKLLSDQAAEFGRERKGLQTQLDAANLTVKDRDALQARLDEYMGIKDDPDGQAAFLKKWEADLKTKDADIKGREAKVSEGERTQKDTERLSQINALAKEHNIDPKALIQQAEELGVTSMSGYKFLAEKQVETKAAEKDTNLKPDSGTGPGGVDVRKMPAAEKVRIGLEQEAKKRAGG